MKTHRLCHLLPFLVIAVFLLTLFTSNATAMRKVAPSGATEEETQEFKDLLQERDFARDRARDRLMEMSKPVGDASVTVKIRHKGDNTDEDSRGEVVGEMKMSKSDYEKASPGEVYAKVKTSSGAVASTRPHSSRQKPSFESSDREKTAMWLLAGLLLAGAVGWWWFSRRFQPI